VAADVATGLRLYEVSVSPASTRARRIQTLQSCREYWGSFTRSWTLRFQPYRSTGFVGSVRLQSAPPVLPATKIGDRASRWDVLHLGSNARGIFIRFALLWAWQWLHTATAINGTLQRRAKSTADHANANNLP
jgi:hypothetical protein